MKEAKATWQKTVVAHGYIVKFMVECGNYGRMRDSSASTTAMGCLRMFQLGHVKTIPTVAPPHKIEKFRRVPINCVFCSPFTFEDIKNGLNELVILTGIQYSVAL